MGRRKPLMRATDHGTWILEEEFQTMVFGYLIVIQKGYEWDGASIPRWAWSLIGHPLDDDHIIASLFHDALYGLKLLPRALCDRIFKELLRRDGVSKTKQNLMYYAVRVGGNRGYREVDSKSNLVSVSNPRHRLQAFNALEL